MLKADTIQASTMRRGLECGNQTGAPRVNASTKYWGSLLRLRAQIEIRGRAQAYSECLNLCMYAYTTCITMQGPT